MDKKNKDEVADNEHKIAQYVYGYVSLLAIAFTIMSYIVFMLDFCLYISVSNPVMWIMFGIIFVILLVMLKPQTFLNKDGKIVRDNLTDRF